MYSIIYSGGFTGLKAYIAHVEVDVSKGLPGFDMVGRLSLEVREAKERVSVALKNAGIILPPVHITVNISPAHIHKRGTGYDLPAAIGIMTALGQLPADLLSHTLMIGELGLNGEVWPVSGILPIILAARDNGIRTCIVPAANAREAAFVEGINILPAGTLQEVFDCLSDRKRFEAAIIPPVFPESYKEAPAADYSDVRGQQLCKRAALIAAAGFHHLLIIGPPGCGKSMIASRIPGIMPPLAPNEILEISSIYSIAGLLNDEKPIITARPFQEPHHGCSRQALTGGGVNIKPGMLTLSHKGVLFMDELPEFRRDCLETLREPLETGSIQVARADGIYAFPADFCLVAAANPCPCGYYPDRNLCSCSEASIARYLSRLSGPLRDRIDIVVTSERLNSDKFLSKEASMSSFEMLSLATKAREHQLKRFHGTDIMFNSRIPSGSLETYCPLGESEEAFMKNAYDSMQLTARSFHKVLKLARTIADLEDCDCITIAHLSEALCYRGWEF